MNPLLVVAGILSAGVGAAHSYLGERYILTRLLRIDLPRLFGSDRFTKRTLRVAWHLTTVAWWGFGAVFIVLSDASRGVAPARLVGAVGAVTFAASAVIVLVGSRGRHLAWIVFAIIALAGWRGTH